MKKILALVAIAAASTTAFAQSGPYNQRAGASANMSSNMYGELGYNMIEIEDNRLGGFSSDNDALSAIVGYRFHPNVSGELFLGTGIGSEDNTVGGANVRSKVSSSYGLFVRPSFMVSDQFEVFGRVGFLRSRLSLNGPGVSSVSGTSPAYGVGANWHFSPNMYGQLAYTSFYDRNDTQAQGVTLGLGMRF